LTVRALVVGSFVMDLAFRVPRRPGPGEVVLAEDFGTFRGGKGYNQAVALARLGAEVTMIGAVGADDHGDGFLDALAREGVDCSRVVQLRGVNTGVAVPLIGPDGDVAFVQHPGANHQLAPAHCADLPDCDVLLL
jgi:ribokinase